MSASTHVDNNLYSVYGNRHGSDEVLTLDGLDLGSENITGIDTPLKISHSIALTGMNVVVPCGLETSVDIDVCVGVNLNGDFGVGGYNPQTPLRIKGNSHHIKLSGRLHARGARGVDVEIGNWMDQDYGLSGTIDLTELKHVDGNKIRVAIGWVKPFTVKLGPNCSYAFWDSIGLKFYVPAKRLLRLLLGIKQGEKGPEWF